MFPCSLRLLEEREISVMLIIAARFLLMMDFWNVMVKHKPWQPYSLSSPCEFMSARLSLSVVLYLASTVSYILIFKILLISHNIPKLL